MTVREEPVIEKFSFLNLLVMTTQKHSYPTRMHRLQGEEDYTKVEFEPDLAKFHYGSRKNAMKRLSQGGTLDVLQRRVFDIAACCASYGTPHFKLQTLILTLPLKRSFGFLKQQKSSC